MLPHLLGYFFDVLSQLGLAVSPRTRLGSAAIAVSAVAGVPLHEFHVNQASLYVPLAFAA